MDKIIRVTSCADCDSRRKWYCPRLFEAGFALVKCSVNKYVDNKTIHPDCPLEDDTVQVLKEQRGSLIKAIDTAKKDATKNIRAVWEKYKDLLTILPAGYDSFEAIAKDCWKAIKADLKAGGEDER